MPQYIFLVLCAVLSFAGTAQEQPTTYIHAGQVADTKQGTLIGPATIVVKGNTIESVDRGFSETPRDSQIIDLKNYTVLPGLIDMHVHIEHETNPNRYLEQYTLDDADVAYRAQHFAEETLLAGFTTVRDLGGRGINSSLRDAIEAGWVDGPRIFSTGKAIATTGGHADPTNGARKGLYEEAGPSEGVANGPAECRQAVRQRYQNGADCIKITATGGVLSVAKSGTAPQFFMDELEAIVRTATDYGMHVAVHAHGAEGMKRAVRAGVTTIEHGTLMTEEVMDLMIERGTYLVPTITAGRFVARKAEIDGYYPEAVVPKAKSIGPKLQNTFAEAYERGVPIVFGTDAGVFPHGQNSEEFSYMVEAGMPAGEALRSATITPAKILNREEEIGQVKEGFLADLIAVKGDPFRDVNVLQQVKFVMKNGEIYARP